VLQSGSMFAVSYRQCSFSGRNSGSTHKENYITISMFLVYVKGKVYPVTGNEGPVGEYRYNSTLSLISVLNGKVVNATYQLLYSWESNPVSIVQEVQCAPGPVWMGAKNLVPPGFDLQTIQLIASCYTDYAILAYIFSLCSFPKGKCVHIAYHCGPPKKQHCFQVPCTSELK